MGQDLDVLRRWEAGGATWRVLARSPVELDIALLTCDAGEQVGRLVSGDPDLLGYVGERTRSDDDPPPAGPNPGIGTGMGTRATTVRGSGRP